MINADKLQNVYNQLYELYGLCQCPLEHASPFQLLVAVVLSAQCRDDRVNLVTRTLFKRFPDAPAFAATNADSVAQIIRSLGLYRNKAANLVAAAQRIVNEFNGSLPMTMPELLRLPGIGRKSANVILGNAFGIPGFPVDTHVIRILNRLKLASSTVPEKIESEITAILPPEYWTNFSHLIITHGRRICFARHPDCAACTLSDCPARSTSKP